MIEAYQSMVMARQHLAKLKLRIEEERKACAVLLDLLNKEYEDIEALEKANVSRLFALVLKNQEEQMEIERQEYLHAAIKYREACKMLELLEFEQKVLEEKLLKEKNRKRRTGCCAKISQSSNQQGLPCPDLRTQWP